MKHRLLWALVCAGLVLCSLPAAVSAADTVLFEGEASVTGNWQVASETTCSADPAAITEGGCFAAEYSTSVPAPAQVYLALNGKSWINVHPTATVKTETGYTAYFSYENMRTACGGSLSGVTAVSLCTYQPGEDVRTTFRKLTWMDSAPSFALDLSLTDAQDLYYGAGTASSATANLAFFYTKHVGGKWDAASINEGSAIYLEYTGPETGVYLAFASASGATPWVAVYPDLTVPLEDGRWASLFTYENFSNMFGTNFARLDQIQAYSMKNGQTTLNKVLYLPGIGAPVDTSDGLWDRPDTGIAFLGDSIVQNPLVDDSHLGCIDWNGILGRTDCSNYGIGGQTTRELEKRIDEVAAKNYDKVVFLCGINDIGRNITNAEITGNYRNMIDVLRKANPDVKIYIISVLPTTPAFYTDAQDKIVGLNTVLKVMAEQKDVTFIDCHSAFVGEDGYCKDGLTFDGLHPNLTGYALIADIVNPILNAEDEPEAPPATEPSPPEAPTVPSTQPAAAEPAVPKALFPLWTLPAALLALGGAAWLIFRKKS